MDEVSDSGIRKEKKLHQATRRTGPGRFPELPGNWENFLLSVLFHMLLPLLPLLLELWINGAIGNHSMSIVAAIYAMSIGASAKSRVFFGLYLFIGFIFSFAYGASIMSEHALANLAQYSLIGIVFVFLTHVGERWNIHVIDGEPYWDF